MVSTQRTEMDGRLEQLQDWFLASPIYKGDGAYAQYYRSEEAGPVYPEITAYAITVGARLFESTGQTQFLDRARAAADYMIEIGSPAVPGIDGETFYTFDTGIMIDGLLTLAALDPEKADRWLSYAVTGLDWMYAAYSGGSYPPAVPPVPAEEVGRYDWHLTQGVHLAKNAIPFIKGGLAAGNDAYVQMGRELLDWGLTLQLPEGRLRIHAGSNKTRLHPHCYALEGLVYAGAALDESKYTEAARRGAEWLVKVQNSDGSFPQWFPSTDGPLPRRLFDRVTNLRVCDVPAQSIRIWKVLGMGEEQILKAESFLEAMRQGGLPLRSHQIVGRELGTPAIFSWPTFFYLHACMLRNGDLDRGIELF